MKTLEQVTVGAEVGAFVEKHGLAAALDVAVETVGREFPGCPVAVEYDRMEDSGWEVLVVEVTSPGEVKNLHRRVMTCAKEFLGHVDWPASARIIMTPEDFQSHAERLLAEGDPASCRSSVSRSYYAAHHSATRFLFAAGVRCPRGGEAHVAAFNALLAARGADDDIRALGQNLMFLHKHRNTADYRWEDLRLEDPARAEEWVFSGREILDALAACLADRDRLDLLADHFREWVPEFGTALGLSLV